MMKDFRSDTVTLPSDDMRAVMAAADVGDDVYGEDPTVNRLQETVAQMAGKQAGLFLPSGTQSNLCALLSHCERGDEYIVGQQAHTYKYEGGGAAVLGSIQPQPLELETDGTLDFARVAATIKPDDVHFARTRLLCLENTIGGKVLPLAYLAEAREFVDRHGLALHLDGARVFNAVVKLNVGLRDITQHFDSISICLSKGLAAPVGSVLVGDAAFIDRARRWRKVLGGGMRQAGVLAAAGLFALEHNVARLAEDHANAARLASGLASRGIAVEDVQTNMVFADFAAYDMTKLVAFCQAQGFRISSTSRNRLVTHRDIAASDIDAFLEVLDRYPR